MHMTTPKPWTYYNDGERCGIVLSVHHDGASPSLTAVKQFRLGSTIVTLAQRDDVLCVSTGDVLVEPGETAYIRPQTDADMRHGWTNDVDECLVISAGIFVEATEDRDAVDGGHLALVKLGGSLFSREAEVAHRARLAEHENRAHTQQNVRAAAILSQPYQRVHIDWTDPPAMQSVEVTQALAFMRYVSLSRKLGEVGLESDAADALRDEMDAPWYEMTQETRELASWAIADVKPMQAPTEPTTRDLNLQPLDEPAAAYWRAIQMARSAVDEASEQLDRARTIRNAEGNAHLFDKAWFDWHLTTELLVKLRKQLPDMPTTCAPLDGGCASCGEATL